jgi:hypothetical protein
LGKKNLNPPSNPLFPQVAFAPKTPQAQQDVWPLRRNPQPSPGVLSGVRLERLAANQPRRSGTNRGPPWQNILFILCWPLALLALVAYPIVWLLLIPFRILGIAVGGVLELVGAVISLPVRVIRAI